MNELLQQLIDFLKSSSPFIWSLLIKQVYVNAISNILWGIGLGVISFFLVKLGIYGKKKAEEDSLWETGTIFAFIGSSIAGFLAFYLLTESIMYFINPQYYAITLIVQSLK